MEEPKLKSDILSFFYTYKLNPGKLEVPKKFLYKIYKEWSYNPTDFVTFCRKLGIYFKQDTKSVLLDKSGPVLHLLKYNKKKTKRNTKNPIVQKQFEDFLASNHIKRGSTYIFLDELYKKYEGWVINMNFKKSITTVVFKDMCKLYLNMRITKKGTLIGVSNAKEKEDKERIK